MPARDGVILVRVVHASIRSGPEAVPCAVPRALLSGGVRGSPAASGRATQWPGVPIWGSRVPNQVAEGGVQGAAPPRSGLDIDDKRKGRVGPAGRDLVLANVKGDGIVALVDADPLTVDHRAKLASHVADHQRVVAALDDEMAAR